MSLSYFSVPTHSFAAGHHFIQVMRISLEIMLPQVLQTVSGSSVHISVVPPQTMHLISSG